MGYGPRNPAQILSECLARSIAPSPPGGELCGSSSQPHITNMRRAQPVPLPSGAVGFPTATSIIKTSQRRGLAVGTQIYHVKASVVPLQQVVRSSVVGRRQPSKPEPPIKPMVAIPIPACVLEHALPDMARQFESGRRRSGQRLPSDVSPHPTFMPFC